MRVIVLIIDGLGMGEMLDVTQTRPQDQGSHTLLHVAQTVEGLDLPNLQRLGLGNLAQTPGLKAVGPKATAAYGLCNLCHSGADTYMGHQELMGTIPQPPRNQLMSEIGEQVCKALKARMYQVDRFLPDASCLLVNDVALVHDNMETDPGLNINVTANLDDITLEALTDIGQVVRGIVDVARVIVVGGRGYTIEDMCHHLKRHAGAVGIDTPALGVYDKWYQVRHLGKGIRIESQAPSLVKQAGFPVALIGKAADVVTCPGSNQLPMVDTKQVFRLIYEVLAGMDTGLVVANVQETDLAGHEQNPDRWGQLLTLVDQGIEQLMERCRPDDVLIITGDHGNDPMIGHSNHTRERTPFLLYRPQHPSRNLGVRATLADVGATVADLFSVGPTEHGQSVLEGS